MGINLDQLFKIIEREKIKVKFKDLSHLPERVLGLFINDPRTGPQIILDKRLKRNRRLLKCILAEEIGHYFTAARTNLITAYTSANLKIIQAQDERKALKWATNFLIPDKDFSAAIKSGCRSKYELAEYFEVTEWFIQRKLEFMQTCYLLNEQIFHFERF